MKKFRKILVLVLIIGICLGTTNVQSIVKASSTTVKLNSVSLEPNNTCSWFPTNQVSGYQLTNGGTQKMKFYLDTKGSKIAYGFMKYSTRTKYSWYSGTLNAYETSETSKTLTGSTAYYQPYFTNNNDTVYITIKSGSYVVIQ